jgi:hypothetical protein
MTKKNMIAVICCFLFSWLSVHAVYALPDIPSLQKEVVDRIVALVNEEVITLTDVRIVKTFNLFSSEEGLDTDIDMEVVLKKLIDQNLVIQLTREDNSLPNDTVDEFIDQIIVEMGVEEFRKRLEQFGMARSDLVPYASECIVYKRVIAGRFKTSASTNLKEIEGYYERIYIPAQEAKGLEVKPMLEILDEIEAVIKEEKNKKQVEEWLKNLRQRADIQVNLNFAIDNGSL